VKPILRYPGAKWRLAPWIISHMPPHESYLEPYFGSGAVFFGKAPARIETINDLDGEVINFFRVCRERPDDLAEALALTPWARAEREAAYEPATDDLERARRFAVRVWQTYGACVSESRGWRATTGSYRGGGPDFPKLWARLPGVVREASERLLEAQIECRPALDVIRRYNGPEVLIYADPPYVHGTRTASGKAYTHEMTDKDHAELLYVLRDHKGPVLLSGYDSDLYSGLLGDWRKETRATTAEKGVKRVECLWINPAARERTVKQMEL
jgi:DNA adenine methylase